MKWPNCRRTENFFIYLIYHDFAKIYGLAQILQKYTFGVVAHGVRDIMSWAEALGAARSGPLAWPRRSAQRRGVRGLAPWATTSGLSAMAHGVSRPPSAVGHDARVPTPI
jgi:hypothetical protein